VYTIVPSQVNGSGIETVLIKTPATVPSQLSVATGTTAGARAAAGQDTTVGAMGEDGTTGTSLSFTTTLNIQDASLPQSSVTVTVTDVVPTGKYVLGFWL
jgi:hypothetical protein